MSAPAKSNASTLPIPARTGNGASGKPAGASPRLEALDFVKGALVVFMVVYHSLNYSADRGLPFQYLAFLPPSFIVITGFLLSRAYFSRPPENDATTRKRLLIRGLKLVLVFAALNVAAGLLGRRSLSGEALGLNYLVHQWFDVFVTGESRSAFEVLLPIGYLLMLGPIALAVYRWHRLLLPLLALGIVVACKIAESQNELMSNGAMLGAGALGVFLGSQANLPLDRLSRFWPVAALAYVGYMLLAAKTGQTYLMQLTGAFLALTILYGIGAVVGNTGWWQRRVVRLGQYSLFTYISQIGFLQILARWIRDPAPASPAFALLFCLALVLTVLSAEITEWARQRSPLIDRGYRMIFA